MPDWNFQRRQNRCGVCQTGFEEGQRHASLLSVQGERLAREDACEACFAAREARTELLYWFTVSRSDRRTLQLDLTLLEQLFIELEGRKEQKLGELRYVVCLLLMRKRRLRIERIQRDAHGESMLVKRPRRKESFAVRVYDFGPERAIELRAELFEVFGGAGVQVLLGGEAVGDAGGSGGGPQALAVAEASEARADGS